MTSKFMTAEEAAKLVKSEDHVLYGGFIALGVNIDGASAIIDRFKKTGEPKDLTLITPSVLIKANDFAIEGLIKKRISSHVGLEPDMSKLIVENKCEAYFLPYSTIVHLTRAMAGSKPGILTKTGLGTFVDPRIESGRMNDCSPDVLSKIETVNGEEYLFYKGFHIDVCLIRGTSADEDGNISTENEFTISDICSIALATKAKGGIVIAEVDRIVKAATIHPKAVSVPGFLVDAITLADPVNPYKPAQTGDIHIPLETIEPMPLDIRKVIGRRAVMEMTNNDMQAINLGIGIPEAAGHVAGEEGISDDFKLIIETGTIGGMPQGGVDFGSSINPNAMIPLSFQLDLFNAGILDLAVLGLAEADSMGNVNVSKFGPRIVGPGGFIDISQNTPFVIFSGTLTAGGLDIAIENGELKIKQEGKKKKFVKKVEQITFSGEYARQVRQKVLFITERCVLDLDPKQGLMVTEIAPGIDLEKDVLNNIDFEVKVAENLKIMDSRLFKHEPMNLKSE